MTGKNKAQGVSGELSPGGSLISDDKLKQLYSTMVHCRLLAEYAAGRRYPAKQVRPYAASVGQEAIAVGWVTDLRAEDAIALAPMDSIAGLVKGVPLETLVAHMKAKNGLAGATSEHNVIAPGAPGNDEKDEQYVAILAAARGNKKSKKRPVVVAFSSAATTDEEPWQQMVRAAVKSKLPIIFVVENNPQAAPPRDEDFAQKARGFGLTGISVDGNDVVAVYRVASESLERIRQGYGPFLVEARAYAASGPGKRPRGERDPLTHMERYLKAKKLLTPRWKKQVAEEFAAKLKT